MKHNIYTLNKNLLYLQLSDSILNPSSSDNSDTLNNDLCDRFSLLFVLIFSPRLCLELLSKVPDTKASIYF